MIYNQKVDFHARYLSPTYYDYLARYEGALPDSFPTPKWSAEHHLQLMEKLGIAFAFLSVSSPNLSRADKETEVQMVRQINREGADIVAAHPDKFGLFAGLPLPHTQAAVEEAVYALDALHADGFGLSTNYGGVYLGDPSYDPLMEALNDRGAVVAVHPTKPAGLPAGVNGNVPIPAMEFFMDTTRTFMQMVMQNVFGRYPNIKWIFPHAGAFLPILSDRIGGFSVQMRGSTPGVPLDFKGDMRHVYFDVAGFPLQKQLQALLRDVQVDNLLYGSDTPYTPDVGCIALAGGLETVSGLNARDKQAMFTENAVRLVPRLGEILGVQVQGGTVCYRDRPLTHKEKQSRRLRGFISKLYSTFIA